MNIFSLPAAIAFTLNFSIAMLASSFPDFNIYPVPLSNYPNIYYYRIKITSGLSVILLVILSLIYITWGTYLLIRKLNKARTNKERTRIKFLLGGVLTIFLGYIIINLFPAQGEKIFSFYFFSTLLTLFISLFFFAAIMQYKLFRLSRLITGSLTYTILSSIVLTIYFLVIKGLSESLGKLFHIYSFFFEALLILLLVLLIRPLEVRIEKLIDRLLYKKIYRYRKNFLLFSRRLMKYFSTDKLFSEVRHFLTENFLVDEIWIFFKKEEDTIYLLWDHAGKKSAIFSTDDHLPEYLVRHKRAVEYFDMDPRKFPEDQLHFFSRNKITLILPLLYDQELVGFIFLPEKNNNHSFTQEETEILSIFSNEVVNVLVRNRIIEKIQEEERERSRMERLAAIGQLTAGVAHEIRNPLNTISTSAETLLNKKLDPEDEKQLKRYILEETRHLNHILTDFLKLSKIRNIDLQQVNVEDFVKEISYEISQQIDPPIDLRTENQLNGITVVLDKELVHQVLINLFINAWDAIRMRRRSEAGYQGRILFGIGQDEKNILFIVEDDGVPIPPEKKELIFDPFYTTKKDGTGLGLSISGNLVKNMGGELVLETTEDKKRFIIKLPKISMKDVSENPSAKKP